ncbi:hypothetical protein LEP1GSC067_5033 [Leptospira interrogans serovar Lora str. TE 1992]|uniref:Uncharacterized protein n=1 Tax=Leptospira interrogans serovar Lora str. TE 1992 TaxID=1193028 RepID=M3DJK4_LEPIR|nr:hypothetical protein LEP1GSC067_5033 [Leptospira interrogans serovar Lora str. TE 1992]
MVWFFSFTFNWKDILRKLLFAIRSFIFSLTNLFLEGLCFLALFQNLKEKGISFFKTINTYNQIYGS